MNFYPFTKLLLGCCLGAGRLLAAQSVSPPGPVDANGHKPLDKPSNLKVLPADIPLPQLIGVMVGFVTQLGVECTHCHMTRPGVDPKYDLNFASDENPNKRKARVMMQMTGEINGRYLAQLPEPHKAGPIVCGNCHQGHAVPPAFVPPPPPPGH